MSPNRYGSVFNSMSGRIGPWNLGEEYYSATGSVAPFSGNPALTGTNDASGRPDFFQFVNGGRQFIPGVTYRM